MLFRCQAGALQTPRETRAHQTSVLGEAEPPAGLRIFTDLLTLLAVISILALVVLPALARTKPSVQRLQCLNNLSELMRDVLMFQLMIFMTSFHRIRTMAMRSTTRQPIGSRAMSPPAPVRNSVRMC